MILNYGFDVHLNSASSAAGSSMKSLLTACDLLHIGIGSTDINYQIPASPPYIITLTVMHTPAPNAVSPSVA